MLWEGEGAPSDIAVDATSVYFADGAIMKITPK